MDDFLKRLCDAWIVAFIMYVCMYLGLGTMKVIITFVVYRYIRQF